MGDSKDRLRRVDAALDLSRTRVRLPAPPPTRSSPARPGVCRSWAAASVNCQDDHRSLLEATVDEPTPSCRGSLAPSRARSRGRSRSLAAAWRDSGDRCEHLTVTLRSPCPSSARTARIDAARIPWVRRERVTEHVPAEAIDRRALARRPTRPLEQLRREHRGSLVIEHELAAQVPTTARGALPRREVRASTALREGVQSPSSSRASCCRWSSSCGLVALSAWWRTENGLGAGLAAIGRAEALAARAGGRGAIATSGARFSSAPSERLALLPLGLDLPRLVHLLGDHESPAHRERSSLDLVQRVTWLENEQAKGVFLTVSNPHEYPSPR